LSAEAFAMTKENDLQSVIDLIYEAVLDNTPWSKALTRLADAMGTAQIGLLSLDRRTRTYDSIAPLTDPVMDAIFKKYWPSIIRFGLARSQSQQAKYSGSMA
jgi:hypothetical protein